MSIGPALILAVLVGVFNAALYVLIRGNAGGRLPIIVVAAILGAWAGDALGGRLGFEVLVDRRLPPAGGDRRGVDRDRYLVGRGDPRPDDAQGMSSDDDRSTASFLRGLTIGAIIGAILAGSSLWSRRRRRRPISG